ncbi:hypothetical protein DFJ73DRAFT_261660 [Zopfochytrium polystomum]|nr:hypothetical protein DFJ73DRAFT_261660 [Zopfochytrium polystomum]
MPGLPPASLIPIPQDPHRFFRAAAVAGLAFRNARAAGLARSFPANSAITGQGLVAPFRSAHSAPTSAVRLSNSLHASDRLPPSILSHASVRPVITEFVAAYISHQSEQQQRGVATRFNFDTYKLVRNLERQGLTRGQAVAIMRVINALLVEATFELRRETLSEVDVDNEMYLYKNHLQELKNELQIVRQNEMGTLRADLDSIARSIDALNQKLEENVAGLKADVAMDMNNHKTEGHDIGTKTDLRIQEINNKLIIELSTLKTRVETMKMSKTREIVWYALLAFAGILTLEFVWK